MIIVSHDRDFLTGLTDKVYEFRNRQLKLHFGDIQAFLEARKIDSLNELGVQSLRRSGNQATTAAPVLDDKQKRDKLRQLDKTMKAQQNKIQKHERDIADLETRLATAKPHGQVRFLHDFTPAPANC